MGARGEAQEDAMAYFWLGEARALSVVGTWEDDHELVITAPRREAWESVVAGLGPNGERRKDGEVGGPR